MVTPQTEAPEIAKALGIERLFLKREDLHPLGSHKGRSIPPMIDMKVAEGAKDFAISSSGNAALAAVRHIQTRNATGDNLSLAILVGGHINEAKRRALAAEITDPRITIEENPRPLQTLFHMIKTDGKTSLRQSTDDEALVGYQSLAYEMAATPSLAAIFIGTSSGTTAQALVDYFMEQKQKMADNGGTGATSVPQINVVQTIDVSPIADEFGHAPDASDGASSLADAVIDKVAHRKEALVESLRAVRGSGWIASNDDIREAQRLLRDKASIDATPNGALGLAGLIRALKDPETKKTLSKGSVVCIITGR